MECQICECKVDVEATDECDKCGKFMCSGCSEWDEGGEMILCPTCIEDNKVKCPHCKEEVEEVYECERCDKEVCLECTSNDYPISATICQKCYEKWMHWCEDNNFPV